MGQRWVLMFLLLMVFSSLEAEPAEKTETHKLTIQFYNLKKAKIEIVNDKKEIYFARLQKAEMAAKTGKVIDGKTLDEMREKTRQHYRDNVKEFTATEKKIIRSVVERIQPVIEKHYSKLAKLPWNFLKVNNHIEGGLPHTRDNFIVLTDFVLKNLSQIDSSKDDQCFFHMASLFLHEKMHVYQRLNPKVFDSIYKDIWGFKKAKKIVSDPWLTKRQLVNPDGSDVNWVFPIKTKNTVKWIWPLVTLKEPKLIPKMPRDFQRIAVTLEMSKEGIYKVVKNKKGKVQFDFLKKMKGYMKTFDGHETSFYHPHELSADMFAKMILADHLLDEKKFENKYIAKCRKKYDRVREAFKKILN